MANMAREQKIPTSRPREISILNNVQHRQTTTQQNQFTLLINLAKFFIRHKRIAFALAAYGRSGAMSWQNDHLFRQNKQLIAY